MGQSRGPLSALDGTARCFRLHDLVAARTGSFGRTCRITEITFSVSVSLTLF